MPGALCDFYQTAIEGDNALDGVVLPKPRRSRRVFYSVDETRRILGAAQDPPPTRMTSDETKKR